MRALLAAYLLGVLGAGLAGAATKTCGQGAQTLTPAAITTTATPTPDVLQARAAPAIAVQAISPSGTATVRLEICCDATCTAASSWAPVEGSDMSLTAAAPSLAKGVANPTCLYRANVTACAGCSVTVPFSCAGP